MWDSKPVTIITRVTPVVKIEYVYSKTLPGARANDTVNSLPLPAAVALASA